MAPERRNPQAVVRLRRSCASRWNTSQRTAAEVARGRRSSLNAAEQRACHRSSRSRSARIAPVSISPLAATARLEYFLKALARTRGPLRIAAGDGPHETLGRCAQPCLLVVGALGGAGSRSDPLARDSIEQLRQADALFPGDVLERHLV